MSRRALLAALVALAFAACLAVRPPPIQLAPGERLVIDVRTPEAFAAGHLPGALNIQLEWGQLAARTPAYVRDRSTPLAVRAADEVQLAEALKLLSALGYRDVAVAAPALESASLELWDAARLRAELESPDPPVVLDTRSVFEFLFLPGDVPGARRVNPDEGPASVAELDPGARYAVLCEAGWRSSQLASWMRRQGFEHVVNVIDGQAGWRALPERPR